jgi:methylase of polypeptide subunit release factors
MKQTSSEVKVALGKPHKRRYQSVSKEKASGVTYTPKQLADFVAAQMLATAKVTKSLRPLRILDPALGDGELLLSLLGQLKKQELLNVEVHGFETDRVALSKAASRLQLHFPRATLHLRQSDFLDFVLKQMGTAEGLFASQHEDRFDFIIANPPYVRTQVMGAAQAQQLANEFALGGRIDLYHAFLLGIAEMLKPLGTSGVIVSNRFMTTKSGSFVRQALRQRFDIQHVWDLGDTKIFNVAVLPAVLLMHGKTITKKGCPQFTSIYETTQAPSIRAKDALSAVMETGVVEIENGRRFEVRHGDLDSHGSLQSIWRIATEAGDAWLTTVLKNTCNTFGDIGKIRVGVKTCADKVFIRDDWENLPPNMQPELLRPLITHHIGRQFKAIVSSKPRKILYPHEVIDGTRIASDLAKNPRSKAYLESNRDKLQSRHYVIQGGRQWYEIWVPQDPVAWDRPKLVFRDISEDPVFWIDLDGSVVNGDCYWLVAERKEYEPLLWLAVAVANSTFIKTFYDHRFNNKLYAGRRRFMTQYVEKFPLPNPDGQVGQTIISMARELYHNIEKPIAKQLRTALNPLVWEAFGLGLEEIPR